MFEHIGRGAGPSSQRLVLRRSRFIFRSWWDLDLIWNRCGWLVSMLIVAGIVCICLVQAAKAVANSGRQIPTDCRMYDPARKIGVRVNEYGREELCGKRP